MYTYIYKHNGKYWREVTDLLGFRHSLEEISRDTHISYFAAQGRKPIDEEV